VVAALEEGGFILAEGSRWLVDDKEVERRRKMGWLSSTGVAFVRGVGGGELLLNKGPRLGEGGTRLKGMRRCSQSG